ncbi:MAG: hypothetical protein ACRENE_12905, partial [Polyangiaceae bacterium]
MVLVRPAAAILVTGGLAGTACAQVSGLDRYGYETGGTLAGEAGNSSAPSHIPIESSTDGLADGAFDEVATVTPNYDARAVIETGASDAAFDGAP